MSESLKQKTVKGVGWSFADGILGQGISFVVGLVLARLLTPEEYGLIGIIMIFIAVFNSIVDSGFSNALIQKQNSTEADYNTTFYFNLIISVFLFIILYVCAPYIAKFFNESSLTQLTRAMGSIVIINSFAIIQRTILVKNIDFKTQTKISIISSSVSGVIGIGMAVTGYGVWSLVGQQISRQLLYSLFLWIYNKWRPKLQFSWDSFKSLFNYGWKLLVSGLIDTLWKQVYQVVIGKCYNTETLGQYTRADQFASICSSNLTSVVQRVSFPVLSSIQDENERMKLAYQRVIKTTMLVTFVLMFGLAACAKSMVQVLVGDQWLPCVPYLQIICFSMALYPLHAINLNMLQVKARTDLFLILEIIKKTIGVIPVLLGIFVGIYWMLWSSVAIGIVCYFLNSFYSGRLIGYGVWSQIKDILPSLGIALIMCTVTYAVSFIPLSPFIMFPLQLIIGATIALSLCKLAKLPEYIECKDIALSAIYKFRHKA